AVRSGPSATRADRTQARSAGDGTALRGRCGLMPNGPASRIKGSAGEATGRDRRPAGPARMPDNGTQCQLQADFGMNTLLKSGTGISSPPSAWRSPWAAAPEQPG